MLYQLSYVRTSAGPTKEDNILLLPASQMLGPHSVRGHRDICLHSVCTPSAFCLHPRRWLLRRGPSVDPSVPRPCLGCCRTVVRSRRGPEVRARAAGAEDWWQRSCRRHRAASMRSCRKTCQDVGHTRIGPGHCGNHVRFFWSTREGGQHLRAIGAGVARFLHTEEVTGSIPVSPTAGSSDPCHADVAQLVEHHLAKVRVAGSNPVVRSGSGASGDRRERLFLWCGTSRWVGRVVRQRPAKPCTRVRIPYPPPSAS